MKKRPFVLRLFALLLAALLLTGCSQDALMEKLDQMAPPVEKNRTISKTSKWIDSSIDGAIDADTPTSVKDDFYTAVNRDFLLEPLPEDSSIVNFGTSINETFSENMNALFTIDPEDTAGTDGDILSPEKLRHIQSLVHFFFAQGADTEGRAKAGVQPLMPFLEQIEAISSLEELTAYFRNDGGQNLFYLQLAPFAVQAPFTEQGGNTYTVMILPAASLSLPEPSDYRDASPIGFRYDAYNQTVVGNVLGRLGYSDAQIGSLLTACYRFEAKLAVYLPDTAYWQDTDYMTTYDTVYTRQELDAFCGSFPLGSILDACGLGASESYTIPCTIQLEELGKLYCDKNLSDIKAYLTVHTVLGALTLLDDETNDMAEETHRQIEGEPEAAAQEQTEEDVNAAIYTRFVNPYLSDAFQQMYVARYCTAQQKADLTDITLRIQQGFRQTLENADWLGEETRAEALAKLDNMGLHILYPDKLIDYTALSFEDCDNLLDAVAKINRFNMSRQADLVNREVDRSIWDLTEIPTTIINAMYMPSNNSVNILAGFLATDETYSTEKAEEENLAGIGTVIGHEITHGFDTSGYEYDQYGHYRSWWTDEDRLSFDTRAADLIRYYSGLTPLGDSTYLNGQNLSGEAIADMGGMKSALIAAKSIPDFDYDLFFRSYARLWRTHCTYLTEAFNSGDVHPLAFLRTNVTVSQFEEFQKTYDIQPGDGMYVAPENRIMVW